MEPKGVIGFRHRRSPSSDRFLDIFSPMKPNADRGGSINHAGDEISEDEVFWTGDFAEPKRRLRSTSAGAVRDTNRQRQFFWQPENFGILAALPEDDRKENRPVVCRKPSILSSPTASSSRVIPAIPKPAQNFKEREYSQSMPSRNFHQSAPMNVPAMPQKVRKSNLAEVDLEDGDDDEMLPPHEIVARGSAASPKTTFSVLEGVGRTLKGRDLRQVRNAVWRKTGFLD